MNRPLVPPPFIRSRVSLSRLAIASLLFGSSTAFAGETLRVPDDHPTLAAALAAAVTDDVVQLGPGTFVVPTTAAPGVAIIGDGSGTTILVPENPNSASMFGPAWQDLTLSSLRVEAGSSRAIRCTGNNQVELTDVTLFGGSGNQGGLLRATDCRVSLHRTTLTGGVATTMGGLLDLSGGVLTAVDSTLESGTAPSQGGGNVTSASVWLQNVSVLGNTATADNTGGLSIVDSTVGISRSTFSGNSSSNGDVGALWTESAAVQIYDTRFEANTAQSVSGGVRIGQGSLTLQGSSFVENQSAGAGGVSLVELSPLDLTDTTFERNEGRVGGGLRIATSQNIAWSYNRFCDNVVTGSLLTGLGGAVASTALNARSHHNLYLRNTTSNVGGGLYLGDQSFSENDTFVGNTTTLDGAAVYTTFANTTVVDALISSSTGRAVADLAGTTTTDTCWFWDNPDGDLEGSEAPTDTLGVDPMLADLASIACDPGPFTPLAGSGLIDTGTGADDPDGSPSDIGAVVGPRTDVDADGVVDSQDCDDSDPLIGRPVLLFADADGDGFGEPHAQDIGCPSLSAVSRPGDCNDADPSIGPGQVESLNGRDDDCNGLIDDSAASRWYADVDGDGFGDPLDFIEAVDQPLDRVADSTDCDDNAPLSNPMADETCGGGDEDCDLLVDDADPDVVDPSMWFFDADSDGFGGQTSVLACIQPSNGVADNTDCDDADNSINPGAAEVCDGVTDEDCDDLVDDDDPDVTGRSTWYIDDDEDGFTGTAVMACEPPPDSTVTADDCDDQDPSISPNAIEICSGIDEDCDDLIDDEDPDVTGRTAGFVDMDQDGFGDRGRPVEACDSVVTNGDDCNDSDAFVYPGASEIPDDEVDQDCDGSDDVYVFTNGASCGCDSGQLASIWLVFPLLLALRRR